MDKIVATTNPYVNSEQVFQYLTTKRSPSDVVLTNDFLHTGIYVYTPV